MKQWEYKTKVFSKSDLSLNLNKAGEEGWRLISAIKTSRMLSDAFDCVHCIFEREKVEQFTNSEQNLLTNQESSKIQVTMRKYQYYKIAKEEYFNVMDAIEEQESAGWELVSVDNGDLYFKREIFAKN